MIPDPADLTELRSQLDALSMRSLELTQEFLTTKAQLEHCARQGNLLMAKARYAGCAVGAAQLPDPANLDEEDEDDSKVTFEAESAVKAQECVGDLGVRFRYLSLASGNIEQQVSSDDNVLSHHRAEVHSESKPENEAGKKKKNDPLRWFGVLVPNSLRQAQKSYQRAIEYSVDAANAKNELLGVENRKKYLSRLEEKMTKNEEQNE